METMVARKLGLISECDYRVVEERPQCGCQQSDVRCLLGRGSNPREPHKVLLNDCLNCITRRNNDDGRPLDENPPAATGDGRATQHHRDAPSQDRGGGAAERRLVVSVKKRVLVAEGGIEQEVLRLEREMFQMRLDVQNMLNFRAPLLDQGGSAFGTTGKGGGFPGGGAPPPTGFGCEGGMPTTLNWSDPILGNIPLIFNPSSGCYESGVSLVDTPAACDGACTAQTGVPMKVVYCASGITTSFKADGGGCPSPGGLGDSLNSSFGWPVPTFLTCDTTNPDLTISNPVTPTSSAPGSPASNAGYCDPNNQVSFGPHATEGDCVYVPRTLYLHDPTYGLFSLHYNDTFNEWTSASKTVTYPGNVNGCGCPPIGDMHLIAYKQGGAPFFHFNDDSGFPVACPANAGRGQISNYSTYTKTSCSPYRATGSYTDTSSKIIPNGSVYTIT